MLALLFHYYDFRRNIYGENAGSVIVQKRNGKRQYRFYLPGKTRDSVSKSGFAIKAEAKAEGEKVRMGMLEGRLTYQGVKSDST